MMEEISMYNRYMTPSPFNDFFVPVSDGKSSSAPYPEAESAFHSRKPPGRKNSFSSLLEHIKIPEINNDTILFFAIAYFLLSDNLEENKDLLIIMGLLFLFGF